MIILFYTAGFIAILSTVCVIFSRNLIHALLFLVLSLLSVSCIFFVLKATLAGALEVIIYAGAIMVLFVFVIMMCGDMQNIYVDFNNREYSFLSVKFCFGVLLLMSSLLIILLYSIFELKDFFINIFQPSFISVHKIGCILFGPYMLVVEMASFLLLSALISVLHIMQSNKIIVDYNTNQSKEYKL